MRAAQQAMHRHAQSFAFYVPQRDIQCGKRGHENRAAAPAPGTVKTMPMLLRPGRILSDQMRREFADRSLNAFNGAMQRRLAPAHKPFVRRDPDQKPVAPIHPEFEGLDRGDFHAHSFGGYLLVTIFWRFAASGQ